MYNYKLFATILIVKNITLKKGLKRVYADNEYI